MAFTYGFKFNREDWLKDKENVVNESVKVGCVKKIETFSRRAIRGGKRTEALQVMRTETRKVWCVRNITDLCKVEIIN